MKSFLLHATSSVCVWGGCSHLLLALLCNLTVDHAPRSRRSTVPFQIEAPPTLGRSLRLFPIHYIERFCLSYPRSVSTSVLWPPSISYRKIAIVFSLLSSWALLGHVIFTAQSRSTDEGLSQIICRLKKALIFVGLAIRIAIDEIACVLR